MSQLSIKSGDWIVVDGVDGDVVLQFDRIGGGCARLTVDGPDEILVKRGKARRQAGDIQSGLSDLTTEILSLFSQTDAASGQELLTQFVSDLFYAMAQRRQKEERRQKQAEGIARAKAKGVQFGRTAKPLPDHFDECYQAWQKGEMSAAEAAEACGITRKAFYNVATRVRETGECAV